jgi:hypothetical protein
MAQEDPKGMDTIASPQRTTFEISSSQIAKTRLEIHSDSIDKLRIVL